MLNLISMSNFGRAGETVLGCEVKHSLKYLPHQGLKEEVGPTPPAGAASSPRC